MIRGMSDWRRVLEHLRQHEEERPLVFGPEGTPALPPRFRLIRELGAGGMGVVFEVEDQTVGRRVALKVLGKGGEITSDQRARFRREGRALARI